MRTSLKMEETVHAPTAFSPFIGRKSGLWLRDHDGLYCQKRGVRTRMQPYDEPTAPLSTRSVQCLATLPGWNGWKIVVSALMLGRRIIPHGGAF